jgi:hypothetical protein
MQGLRNASCAIGIAAFMVAPAMAQTKTTTPGTPMTTTHEQTINFTIVGVDGNKVIVKNASGTKEVEATDDMKFTVDGQQVTYRDLKPGMKGSARITTTTTVTPVHITEIKTGEVIQKSGNSIIVRTENGIKMFSEGDIEKRNITIFKDGQPAHITDFNVGNKLSASIVTTGTPRVLSQRQVDAILAGAPVPADRSVGTGGAASRGASAGSASAGSTPALSSTTASTAGGSPSAAHSGRKLPKTATAVPAVGATGALFLFLGVALTLGRRRTR